MASTWEDLLQLELQATGENSTTWGSKTNDNFERLADAIAGHESISVAGSGDYTISQATAVGATFRKAFLTLTGILTGARVVVLPAFAKTYFIRNATTGDFAITIKTASGTAATIGTSGVTVIVCDGLDCYRATDANAVQKTGDTMTGPLAITSGGITVSAGVSMNGGLFVGGAVSVSGAAHFAATVSVSGAAAFNSTVSVSGAATFKGAVSVSSTLIVGGAATFRAGISVSGTANILGAVSVGGAALFSSTVSIASTLNVTGAVSIGGAVSITGAMVVAGAATFNSAVTIVGSATFKGAVSVAGAFAVGGALLTSGDLDVAGVGEFASVSIATSVGIIAANAAKAWANFNGNTGALHAAYGIVSVTRTAAGTYTITFTNALINANYAAFVQTDVDGMNSGNRNIGSRVYDLAAGSFKVAVNGDNAPVDPTYVHVLVFNHV